MINNNKVKSDEVTFNVYKRNGCSYIKARQWVTLIDGTLARIEGNGKNRVDARSSLQTNIEKRNERIPYGMKKDDGDITLAEAVKNLIEERAKEYDREKGREARRDVSTKREWDVYHSLLCPFEIANKKLNCIFVKDIETYRKQLSNARYDKHVTKKKHEPEYVYYSASTLNRIIRLVVTAIDDYYLYRPEKSPAIVLKQFKQSSPAKTEANILDVMRGWLGFSEANGKFKEIIDLYNNVKPLPRGYAMQYSDECCDTCVSAAEIKAGCSELIGRECGVEEHVKIFKKLWIWIEDGTITPEPGYAIVYNLDKAVQPNGGYSDHIGFVEKVSGGMVTAIEGNRGEKVARRVIPLGWGYIRGYAAPQYEKAVNGNGGNPGTGKKRVEALAKEVLAGKWGERRGQKEETAGCGI